MGWKGENKGTDKVGGIIRVCEGRLKGVREAVREYGKGVEKVGK